MTMRADTGRLQFADDWPGVFICGDEALGFAVVLRSLLQEVEQRADVAGLTEADARRWVRVQELAAILESCRAVGDIPG